MFVVCGEALMDVFGAGDTPAGTALDAQVGGSPFNVAVGLARLAQPVSFYGAVSIDFLGERLLRALRDEGVGTSSAVRVDAPTTLGLVGLDSAGVPSYAFYGEHGAERRLGVSTLAQVPAAAALHIGSYAAVVEPAAGTLRTLVERAHGRSLIAYDPNVRLAVQPALERWREALSWMARRTGVLKISAEDLELLYPGAQAASFAQRCLADGTALVVVTRGAGGAQAWTQQAHASTPALPAILVDTVGAGDSFQAALLAWLAEHDALSAPAAAALPAERLGAALRFASQAAAITCGRRGADLPRRAELPA